MESEVDQTLRPTGKLRYTYLKGKLFEGVLVAATLVGVVSLSLLFGYLFFDAFKPQTASASWYLLFFGTLVAPISAFTLYIRTDEARRTQNARAFAAVFGGLAFTLSSWVVLEAIRPQGPFVYLFTVGVPLLAISAYSRHTGRTTVAGPAMAAAAVFGVLGTFGTEVLVHPLLQAALFPVRVLLGTVPLGITADTLVPIVTVGGPTGAVAVYVARRESPGIVALAAVPVVAGLSFLATGGVDSAVRPYVETVPVWLVYGGVVAAPVAGIVGILSTRRETLRQGARDGIAVLAGFLLAGALALGRGLDPSFWVVLFAGVVVPTAYVVGTGVQDGTGRSGLAGPFVLLGGVLLGAGIEDGLGVVGPDTWVTPTLLLNTWNGIDPAAAGAYPSIVGSILIVSVMAILAFPVGIAAAIYLEEYAPDTGWKGRLTTLLEINIANLAGVPSVVYGLLGLALFNNTLDFAPGLVISASATLGLLILPIVIVSAQEAVRAVPDSLREASYGMGGSRWQTLRNVVLPEAVPGILTGTILALGRAIGETAPLIIIAVPTTTFSVPSGIFSSGAALPLKIFSSSANAIPAYRKGVVAALAVVLLILMLTMNAVAIIIRNKYQS